MIALESLAKRFGAVEAVRDVSLTAADGRVTGLLGPNGAGKSTTLRLLYGVLRPDGGRALVDGLDVAGARRAALARLGVLPHNAGLYPLLTARENIRYYGALHGMHGAALERRIDELGALLDLGAVLERRTRGFSQGERLKVALARALVHNPPNLVLDEPTNGLDVLATRSLRELIRRLRDAGHCLLFSSHVMQEVAALCDDIVIIGAGRVVARGTPEELRGSVASGSLEDAFVAALHDGSG
ncbi:MAG TPA: ATP-binding cassette domain-containing protein [Steroidobacteraceae bacterium]|nr:ATP-binding cassette domain-containing protein [Steroidobacteraceae bacterium]